MRRTRTATATIANGASLSGAVAILDHVIASIQMPADWTAANLTFQGSLDGSTFWNLYDDAGGEVTVVAAEDRTIVNGSVLEKLAGLHSFKVRSGTSAAAVNQGAERVITFLFKD